MSPWRRRLDRILRHPGDLILLARVATLAAVVRPLLNRIGVSRTARLIRPSVDRRDEKGLEALWSHRARVLVEFADPRTSRWTEGACLERSLLLYRLLNLEGIPVDLTIGLRSDSGRVAGHAWLTRNGKPILEPKDPATEFSPMLCFPSPFSGEIAVPQVLSQAQGHRAART